MCRTAGSSRGRVKKRKEAEEVALFTRKLQQRTSVSPAAPDEPPAGN